MQAVGPVDVLVVKAVLGEGEEGLGVGAEEGLSGVESVYQQRLASAATRVTKAMQNLQENSISLLPDLASFGYQ